MVKVVEVVVGNTCRYMSWSFIVLGSLEYRMSTMNARLKQTLKTRRVLFGQALWPAGSWGSRKGGNSEGHVIILRQVPRFLRSVHYENDIHIKVVADLSSRLLSW